MTQCIQYITDACNEYFRDGVVSKDLVDRLQMVYDRLRTSENISQDADVQTMSNLKSMMNTSIAAELHVPSLLNMTITPPVSVSSTVTAGVVEPSPLSAAVDSHQHLCSRSRSVEKALLPTPTSTDGRTSVHDNSHTQSPESHSSSVLANSVTMELGSEVGGEAYSPFDSPFNLSDTLGAADDGQMSEFGGICTQGTFMTGHNNAAEPNSDQCSSVSSRAKPAPPPPPPPVLSPQDVLAARISDEITLIEVLVRIQFELSCIGDLSVEDTAALSGTAVTSGPSTPPAVCAPAQSPPITTTASTDPQSLLRNTADLPALPSPSSLQELISKSVTPTSSTNQSPAAVPLSTVSLSHNGTVLPSAVTGRTRMPYTPPTAPTSTPSIASSVDVSEATKPSSGPMPPVTGSTVKASVSTTTKPQSSAQTHRLTVSMSAATLTSTATLISTATLTSTATSTSGSTLISTVHKQPKTSSTARKSETANKSTAKDGSEQVSTDCLLASFLHQ